MKRSLQESKNLNQPVYLSILISMFTVHLNSESLNTVEHMYQLRARMRCCESVDHIYPKYLDRQVRVKSVDIDQTPQEVASYQGLHYLQLMPQCF